MSTTIDNKNEEDELCPICGMMYHNKITVTKVRSKYKVRDDAKFVKAVTMLKQKKIGTFT